MQHRDRSSPESREEARPSLRLKTIGPSGQIALGKELAGRTASIEQPEPGVWIVRLGSFVPDNERWLWTAEAQAALARAEDFAAHHKPATTDLDALEAKLTRPPRSRRSTR